MNLNNPSGGSGGAEPLTNAQIKTAYENNANTNEFSDTEKAKLSTVQDRANHTGVQAISTIIGLQSALDNSGGGSPTDFNGGNFSDPPTQVTDFDGGTL